MGLESLLSELLVSTIFDSIYFHSVGVSVDVMVLGEQVGHWEVECSNNGDHADDYLGVGNLVSSEIGNILRHVMSHLGSGRRSTVIVFDHTIMELRGHSNNHVIEVWVEITTLRYINTEWGTVVITSQQVVGVVMKTRVHGTSL
jgi:hypothetical protein